MTVPAPGPLRILSTALALLKRHPLTSLGIAALATALSGAVPLLQLWLKLPDDLLTETALSLAAMVPLHFYALPRLLAFLDAETVHRPENPIERWKEHFEERWLKGVAAFLLLSLLVWIGLALIIPAIVIALLLGWVPYRILLRGDSFTGAILTNRAMAAKSWPRVLGAGLGLLAVMMIPVMGLLSLLLLAPSDPTLWQRAVHPVFWIVRFLSAAVGLTLQICFLALYWSVESILDNPSEPV
jgi:hypothetical protein